MSPDLFYREYIYDALKCMLSGYNLEIRMFRNEISQEFEFISEQQFDFKERKSASFDGIIGENNRQKVLRDCQVFYNGISKNLPHSTLKMCRELADMMIPSKMLNEQIKEITISLALLSSADDLSKNQISIQLIGECKLSNFCGDAEINTCFMANKGASLTEKFEKMYTLLAEPDGDFSEILEVNENISYSLN